MEDRVWDEAWCSVQFEAPVFRCRNNLNLRDLALQNLAKFLQIEFRWQVFPATPFEVNVVDGSHGIKWLGIEGCLVGETRPNYSFDRL